MGVRQTRVWAIGLSLLLLLVGVAHPAAAEEDYLEEVNKAVHDFNARLSTSEDNGSLISTMVNSIPPDVKFGLFNFYSNMTEPLTAVSSLLRGDVDNSWTAMNRFFVNLTFGWGGFVDAASGMGIQSKPVTLGQAICGYGVPDGPFLVIPFYGPATLSDFVAAMVPATVGYMAFGYAFAAYRAGTMLAEKDPEHAGTPPPQMDYETAKTLYLEQRRRICAEPPDPGTPVAGSPVPEQTMLQQANAPF